MTKTIVVLSFSIMSLHAAAIAADSARGAQLFEILGLDGSLVDPAYLSLISDQGLRSFIIAGQPEQGMPDWRSHQSASGSHALTDREITDIVAWIAAHRPATPVQGSRQHP